MLLQKQVNDFKSHLSDTVSVPVRQATGIAILAVILSVIAIVIAVKGR